MNSWDDDFNTSAWIYKQMSRKDKSLYSDTTLRLFEYPNILTSLTPSLASDPIRFDPIPNTILLWGKCQSFGEASRFKCRLHRAHLAPNFHEIIQCLDHRVGEGSHP